MKKVRWKCATLLAVGLFCICLSSSAQDEAAAKRVTIEGKNVPIERVFKEIQKQTKLKFLYDPKDLNIVENDDWDCHNVPVGEILRHALGGKLPYAIQGGTVVINMKLQWIDGTVKDAKTGEPLVGATIMDKELSRKGTICDERGHFVIGVYAGTSLTFSYMGYETQNVKVVLGKVHYTVQMQQAGGKQLNEVVVTGIVNRKANSFTGSVSSFTTEDLQKVGSQNVIKSLEALEPSMLQVTNLTAGSNPNAMPTLELNGTSSFPDVTGQYTGNPNQPLFILNGFESSLQSILDLDMNLVKSVTILKDASAKAIYGSKASNGVVIVETKRPQPGKLQIYYNGAVTLEVPDLTSYNLANASEKLQAEVLSGQVYTDGYNPSTSIHNQTVYNDLYKEVMRGVNTYWLSAPLRTGIGNRHTLSIDGGNENYIYSLDLSYNKVTGAMKGSDRSTLSGNVLLEYRVANLAIQNNLFVNYNQQNNPYHSFADYAKQNPYWRKYGDDGKPVKEFEGISDGYYNPLWDDQWKAYNKSNYTEITNNFNVDWTILPALRLVGRFNFTKNNAQSDEFESPFLTTFLNMSKDETGSYTKGSDNTFTMGGDLNLSYSHTIADRHIFFYDVGTSFQTSNNDSYSFTAYGFPNETDFLYFAKGYKANDKPSAGESKDRELSFLGIFNYSFMDRYMLDASIRTTGSSQFGRDKRWGNFWSTGLGWNLHNEPFIKEHAIGNVIKLLKIRGSYGYSGSQDFNAYQAIPTYAYNSDYYFNGTNGAYLQAFPNTKLQWQSKLDKNIGADINLWNKFNLTANYYISTTKNSISQLTVAPSIGFTSYAENIGDIENKGYDLNASYTVFNKPKTRSYLILNFSVASNTNRIKKISDAMRKYNENMDKQLNTDVTGSNRGDFSKVTKPLPRYVEGRALTAIWGVRSAGIDPLNGKEVFIRPNGEKTYTWNANDQVVIGDSRPKAHGTFGFSLELNGFSLNTVCSYQVGGDYYNTTLVDKVENANIFYNVDRRYLYNRWKNPGDVSYFKDIADGNPTKPTSRFIMTNNQLILSSINVGYDFRNWKFCKRLGFTSLKISAYMNDIATFSTVRQERGTDYPFARNMNFSISLNY